MPRTLAQHLSRRVQATPPGQREELMRLAAGLPDVIPLARGDPDLPTPAHIVEAGRRALLEGHTHYTHWQGIPELRRAISEKLRRENNVEYSPDEIIVTGGAQEAVFISVMALVDPGDQVIIGQYRYGSYDKDIAIAGGTVVTVPMPEEDNHLINPADVERAVTDRTKALVVVTPDNPTAAVFDRPRLEALADSARRHDLVVISDEIYEKIIYDDYRHHSVAALPGMRDRTVLINGYSKAYAMTGWRIGYLAAPAEVIRAVQTLRNSLNICAPAVSQWAALAAVEGPQDCVREMVRIYDERRRAMMATMDAMGLTYGYPAGGMFFFLNISSTGLPAFEFCKRLLTEGRVQISPGHAFGAGDEYVRMSFLTPMDKLKVALERFGNFVASVKAKARA